MGLDLGFAHGLLTLKKKEKPEEQCGCLFYTNKIRKKN